MRRSDSRTLKIEGTRGYIAPEIMAGGCVSRNSDVRVRGCAPRTDLRRGAAQIQTARKGGNGIRMGVPDRDSQKGHRTSGGGWGEDGKSSAVGGSEVEGLVSGRGGGEADAGSFAVR
ncbi:hypothetical protein HPP92_025802 [Vanilla planifolia]|uniref:Uncharacterized protein n=1 Tax=Vanilla planifolia TaxID=51239 RepID=A0A835PKQ4_VANPL|nr:hypothetical protein HPP92_025802 [Vanilla planifolia]